MSVKRGTYQVYVDQSGHGGRSADSQSEWGAIGDLQGVDSDSGRDGGQRSTEVRRREGVQS